MTWRGIVERKQLLNLMRTTNFKFQKRCGHEVINVLNILTQICSALKSVAYKISVLVVT